MPGAGGDVKAVAVCRHTGSVPGDGFENLPHGCVPTARQQKDGYGCLPDHKGLPGRFRNPEGAGDGAVYLVPHKGQREDPDRGRYWE